MTKTTRALILSAAMAGLITGTMAITTGCSSDNGSAGTKASDSSIAKHDCKGMNACKGQGGCKSSENDCKGKNSCKGKGGCKVT